MKKLCDVCDEISSDFQQRISRLRRHLAAAGIKLDDAEHWKPLDFSIFFAKWDFDEFLPNLALSFKTPSDHMRFCRLL